MCPETLKVEVICALPVPRTKWEVQAFPGVTGYYQKLIPNFTTIAAPLSDLVRKGCPAKVNWTAVCEKVFAQLKKWVCSSPVLQTPGFSRPFILQTDTSERGVRAVLSQLDDQRDDQRDDHPTTAYFSCKLQRTKGGTVFNYRKRVLGDQTGYTTFPCIPVGKTIRDTNWSPLTGVVGPSQGKQFPVVSVELVPPAISVLSTVLCWSIKQ